MAEKKEKERVKIPPEIVSEAMHLSDSTCCKCREPRKAVQTHHIDEDPSNSHDIDNIAVLCLQCHDETMLKGGFGRKFNADLVKKYRDAWYADVQKRRGNAISVAQTEIDTYYDDLEDVEFDDNKTRKLHKHTRTNFSYVEFKEAIENYLYLNDGDQKVLIKLLKDFLKNGELDIPKIIRKNQNFIIEINNLKKNNFLSFYGGWQTYGMDLDGFTTDPNEDIRLAVGIKEGWSLPYCSIIITDIYLYFGEIKQEEFSQKLLEETC